MRTLTKTGIRMLSAKYRYILIKCAIINASVFIGMVGTGSAFAEDYIEQSQVRNSTSGVVSLAGAAIYNSPSSAMTNINANFISNFLSATSGWDNSSAYGGAIYNNYEMQNINGNFTGNYSTTFNTYGYSVANGGAIYNMSDITSIHGDFNANYVSANASMQLPTAYGGAIYNTANIGSITGDFVGNYALASSTQFYQAIAYGGAIYNTGALNIVAQGNKNLKFDGNYVIGKRVAQGGAIYNTGTVGLYAQTASDSITFTGTSAVTGAYDVDGIYNTGTLNINGHANVDADPTSYAGTVNLYNVDGTGTTNIYGGTVNVAKDLTQKAVTVASGATLTTNGNVKTTDGIANEGTLNLLGGKNESSVITYAIVDSTVSGDGTTNFGNGTDLAYVQTNGAISQAVTIKQHTNVIANAEMGAEGKNIINYSGLTISADNVKGDIINGPGDSSSVLTLTEGTLTRQITGGTDASTIISDGKVIAQNTIQQARLSIDNGATLETDANNLVDIGWFFNQGNLNLTGGTLSSKVFGNGTTNIESGVVNANANIEQNIINVNSGATLASNTAGVEITADGTDGNLINDGTINITGANSRFGADYLTNNATINITGANSLLETGTLTNNGTMDIVSLVSESLNNNGNITTSGAIEALIQNNEGGSITFNGDAKKQMDLTNSGTVNFNGGLSETGSIIQLTQNDGVMNFSTNAIESTTNLPINIFSMNGGSVNIADGNVNTLHIKKLNLTGNTNFAMDADLAGDKMDQLNVIIVSGSGNIVVSDIKLLSDANDDYVELSLFADGTTTDVYNKVSGNLNGLKYSTIYKYDALYDSATGKIGFTRYNSGTSDDFNPYLYAPSGVANTTAAMTTQIATLAMDKMDEVVHTQGRSGGDTPSSSNAWVKVMGLNDDVEFNNFENIDSKALTVVGGYNTDKITWADNSVVFGAYAGYIGGKQHYTANDIDQNGAYVGLSSALTFGDAFLTATVNGGLLKNKANNMYGTDRFNTLWLGAGIKTGYNFAITDSVVLQPNVYGGYTLVNTKDYTSVSGVKIATNNLNFFEVDPGLKLSAVIADGWTGSVQGKYAIVMDNGADITANDFALQNISTKNYIEYGIGIDKSVTDAFYLGAKVNRHDGGRTGWNGSIEFRYKF